MSIRTVLAVSAALALLAAAPAVAGNDGTPPGNPCAKGNGNPCNGNNGNLGHQGNADKEEVEYGHEPPPIDIAVPPISGRGAFITQIGDANVTTIKQTAPDALAIVWQDGEDNEADVAQEGGGLGYVEAKQTGDRNFAGIVQDGVGQNVLYLNQTGTGNWASSRQTATGALHNGAIISQAGTNNDLSLVQDGSDNRAILNQQGNGNGMTAVQNGDRNRLAWSQQGNNLSYLGITQNGGQAIQITQIAGK